MRADACRYIPFAWRCVFHCTLLHAAASHCKLSQLLHAVACRWKPLQTVASCCILLHVASLSVFESYSDRLMLKWVRNIQHWTLENAQLLSSLSWGSGGGGGREEGKEGEEGG